MATESPSRKEASHIRILDAAARAIRRAGHAGVSVADVMKEAGLTHGGFYAHFGSRDEMVAAAIDYAGQQSGKSLGNSMTLQQEKGTSPFRSLVNAYLSPQHMESPDAGCVVAALGSEMPRQSDAVRAAARERVLSLVRTVESVLPPPAAAEASHVAGAMVGALQMARVLGGAEGKALLAANRRILLERYDPENVKH
ncbi:transcriptional regulator, TetR family [Noviherbaspirillum humi]|uniref:Transcriptional regulator, TetR family n=1 Tax=Noviherbaspirillum humi TaxID=1688639 RepID=A0A239EWZ3_9BURK|nr:TetR/AcrR family transcriptional regulator [Noviherbaspirillum humi]SNS49125.1 transcriptional regulator, TetR family [Noviherbaspirillum humi]